MQLNADVHKYLWDLDPITMWIMQRHPWVLRNVKINSVANRWIDFELWSVDVVKIAKLIWKVQHFWHIGTLLQNSEIKEVENYEIDFEECDVKYNFLHGWVDIIAVSLFADWSSLSNPNKNLTKRRAGLSRNGSRLILIRFGSIYQTLHITAERWKLWDWNF